MEGKYGTMRATSMTAKPRLPLYLSRFASVGCLLMIFSAASRKKKRSSTKLRRTPTVSAATERKMPQKMPKISVLAVEKMMAGGKPSALTKSVKRKLKSTAHSPKEAM